jgi:uncharacterized protein YcbX
MALFSTEIIFPAADEDDDDDDDATTGKIIVTYRPPPPAAAAAAGDREEVVVQRLQVPLCPSTEGLEVVQVDLYRSLTAAYKMPAEYNAWFSSCFGFDVVLAYLGDNRRPVLRKTEDGEGRSGGGGSWVSSITKHIPYLGGGSNKADGEDEKVLTFTDLAPYLIVSETSLRDVSSRLPDGEEMEITKFRPNIVVSGDQTAYEEDFWGEIAVNDDIRFALGNNCGRCVSINVDFQMGTAAVGEAGMVLMKLMADRRVDKGQKYSPVFGRYGFLAAGGDGLVVKVGDEVEVTKRSEERRTFGEPFHPLSDTDHRLPTITDFHLGDIDWPSWS